jgi:hypothetical protein
MAMTTTRDPPLRPSPPLGAAARGTVEPVARLRRPPALPRHHQAQQHDGDEGRHGARDLLMAGRAPPGRRPRSAGRGRRDRTGRARGAGHPSPPAEDVGDGAGHRGGVTRRGRPCPRRARRRRGRGRRRSPRAGRPRASASRATRRARLPAGRDGHHVGRRQLVGRRRSGAGEDDHVLRSRRRTSASSSARSGPLPTTAHRSPGTRWRRQVGRRSRSVRPFWGCRRATVTTSRPPSATPRRARTTARSVEATGTGPTGGTVRTRPCPARAGEAPRHLLGDGDGGVGPPDQGRPRAPAGPAPPSRRRRRARGCARSPRAAPASARGPPPTRP